MHVLQLTGRNAVARRVPDDGLKACCKEANTDTAQIQLEVMDADQVGASHAELLTPLEHEMSHVARAACQGGTN